MIHVHVLSILGTGNPWTHIVSLEGADVLTWPGPQVQWDLDRAWLRLTREQRIESGGALCYNNGAVKGFGVPYKRNGDGVWLPMPAPTRERPPDAGT